MITCKKRIDYKLFLIISIALILIINMIPRIPREILITIFYYILLPFIFVFIHHNLHEKKKIVVSISPNLQKRFDTSQEK